MSKAIPFDTLQLATKQDLEIKLRKLEARLIIKLGSMTFIAAGFVVSILVALKVFT